MVTKQPPKLIYFEFKFKNILSQKMTDQTEHFQA